MKDNTENASSLCIEYVDIKCFVTCSELPCHMQKFYLAARFTPWLPQPQPQNKENTTGIH